MRQMFETERAALREALKLSRPTLRETLIVAALYAAQAIVCVVFLSWLYHSRHWLGAVWAMIAAILALQPGLSQSVVTSVIRIAANTVGAGVALGVAQSRMRAEYELILSLVIIVFTCELLRLNLALRTACVAAVIVLTANDGHVLTSGVERFTATIMGCLAALVVQACSDALLKVVLPGRSTAPVKS